MCYEVSQNPMFFGVLLGVSRDHVEWIPQKNTPKESEASKNKPFIKIGGIDHAKEKHSGIDRHKS